MRPLRKPVFAQHLASSRLLANRYSTATRSVVACTAAVVSISGLTACSGSDADSTNSSGSSKVSVYSVASTNSTTKSSSSTSSSTTTTSVPAPANNAPQTMVPQVRPGGTPRIGQPCTNRQGEVAQSASGQTLICTELGNAAVWSVRPDDSQWGSEPQPRPEQPSESPRPSEPETPQPNPSEPLNPSEPSSSETEESTTPRSGSLFHESAGSRKEPAHPGIGEPAV